MQKPKNQMLGRPTVHCKNYGVKNNTKGVKFNTGPALIEDRPHR